MLQVPVEELLSATQYEGLVNLFLELRDREPHEIQILRRYTDGSGYREGVCDICGRQGIVYQWHNTRLGGVAVLSICPLCNGGKQIVERNGRYYLVPMTYRPQ